MRPLFQSAFGRLEVDGKILRVARVRAALQYGIFLGVSAPLQPKMPFAGILCLVRRYGLGWECAADTRLALSGPPDKGRSVSGLFVVPMRRISLRITSSRPSRLRLPIDYLSHFSIDYDTKLM